MLKDFSKENLFSGGFSGSFKCVVLLDDTSNTLIITKLVKISFLALKIILVK